jgi:hypothetical protein
MNTFFTIETAIEAICKNYLRLSDSYKNNLKKYAGLLTFDKLTAIIKRGQHSDKTFYLLNGAARAYYQKGRKDITEWFAFENGFISPVNNYFLNSASPYNKEVLVHTVLIEISINDMFALCNKHPGFNRLCRIIVTNTMLQSQQRMAAVQFKRARQQYKNLIDIRSN